MELPQAYKERMSEMLGDEYGAFQESVEQPQEYGLRVNTLKITPEAFRGIAPFPTDPVPWVPNGFYCRREDGPSKHPYYCAGLYYLQEPSAMTPASRLPVMPGDRVLDLCAAPGGKATELGAALKGSGILVANEISASRAKALLKNIEMTGISNSFITNEIPAHLSLVFDSYFDKILVDAPCSGEGMFRKEPEVMKVWNDARPAYFANLQKDILNQAVEMLRPGGLLLYSTCTFSKEENEGSISGLLRRYPDMRVVEIEPYEGFASGRPDWGDGNPELERCVRIWPHRMRGEGHFLALMQKEGEERKEDHKTVRKEGKPLDGLTKQQRVPIGEFFRYLRSDRFTYGLEVRNNRVYQVPDIGRDVRGLKFIRNGLAVGELRKNRFEPSQAFAMALRAEEFDSVLRLAPADVRLGKYLRGETVPVASGETSRDRGWQLVCAGDWPVGWGKLTGGVLKNKYLQAWRVH